VAIQTRQHEPPDDDRKLTRLAKMAKGRHRRSRRPRWAWPRAAEKLLGGWAPTLRIAVVLMLVLTAGLTVVVAAWGVFGVACVVLLCALLHRIVSRLCRRLVI
jgi:hypothetical protein